MRESIFAPEHQETVANAAGGLQSKLPGAFYQLPGRALRRLRTTWLGKGRSYQGHIDAALDHLIELLQDNPSEDHLGCTLAHLAWAVECEPYVDEIYLGSEDGFPYAAVTRIALVMGEGAKRYARGNWRLIEYQSQIDHALQHLVALGTGNESDDHLGHALTRCAMAVEVEDADYRFTGVDPVANNMEAAMPDRRPDPGTNAHFDHVNAVHAIRAALLQGDMTFLGALTDDEWAAFTAGPMMREFIRRDESVPTILSLVVDNERLHSFDVGAFIGDRPEYDGD